MQARFRLALPRVHGESARHHAERERFLNQEQQPSPSASHRLAAHLKAQAREVMRSVTECPPAAIGIAVSRLIDLDNTIALILRLGLVDESEAAVSDLNPCHAVTLADYRNALAFTRRNNRGPAYVSRWAEDLERLEGKIDLLASVIGRAAEGGEQ